MYRVRNSAACICQDSFDYWKQNLVSMFMKNTLKKRIKNLYLDIIILEAQNKSWTKPTHSLDFWTSFSFWIYFEVGFFSCHSQVRILWLIQTIVQILALYLKTCLSLENSHNLFAAVSLSVKWGFYFRNLVKIKWDNACKIPSAMSGTYSDSNCCWVLLYILFCVSD